MKIIKHAKVLFINLIYYNKLINKYRAFFFRLDKRLTPGEEQVMQIVRELKYSSLKNIMQKLPAPRPTSATVSMILQILRKKGFLECIAYKGVECYYPVAKKDEAKKSSRKGILSRHKKNRKNEVLELEKLLEQLRK